MGERSPIDAWRDMPPERRLEVLEVLDGVGGDCESLVAKWPPPQLRDDIETAKHALRQIAMGARP